MDLKEFLRFEKKKMILPIIFLAMLLYTIFMFQSMGYYSDKSSFHMIEYLEERNEILERYNALKDNNASIEDLKKTENILEQKRDTYINITDGLYEQYDKALILSDDQRNKIFHYSRTINPFLPVSCMYISNKNQYCRHYISKDTYDILYGFLEDSKKENKTASVLLSEPDIESFKPITNTTIILNALFVIIEGYLISCIILFGLRKGSNYYRSRKSQKSISTQQADYIRSPVQQQI